MNTRAPGAIPDAEEIFRMHEEREAGLSPSQIGARHELSGTVIQQLLRPRANTTLPTPFELAKDPSRLDLGVPLYWLGFITASGRAFHRTPSHPLVLTVDAADLEHVRTMVADLLRTHPTYEFCLSSRDGHQAYIRERDLGEAVTHWGLTTDPREAAPPVDYIPAALLPHFVRGLIEGQITHPPFGGRAPASTHPSPRVRRVVLPGASRFLEALRLRLLDASPAIEGEVSPVGASALLTFSGRAALALLRYAYADPVRCSPRANRLVRAFGPTASA
ncbi:MAG: hypothetical protein QN209_12850 [Armatimonadota bacterium]|nr:hypothetical protein [Armatimonadota bacterium]MDR7465559.1 hypothetical protein [Armatimonadota bacterium]